EHENDVVDIAVASLPSDPSRDIVQPKVFLLAMIRTKQRGQVSRERLEGIHLRNLESYPIQFFVTVAFEAALHQGCRQSDDSISFSEDVVSLVLSESKDAFFQQTHDFHRNVPDPDRL